MRDDLRQGTTSSGGGERICVRCVMDTTHREIAFDAGGVCNFCREYEADRRRQPVGLEARRALDALVASIKEAGRHHPYDCILGVSGGVDSSYLALLVRDLGLRALAVQFDNGWNSELAVRNIELLCKNLNMDLFTYVVEWDEFRDLQLAILKASLPDIEGPSDHAIVATLYHSAAKHGIRFILNGNNLATEGIVVPSYGYASKHLRQILAIHARHGSVPLRTFPQLSFMKRVYYEKVLRLRSVSLLNLIDYDKKQAIERLEREIGWRNYGGKHHESIITRFHQAYLLPRKFGLDKRKAHFSCLIYSGQMTRDEALAALRQEPCPPELLKQDREFVIKKLGLTEAEFEAIMNAPAGSYDDYPNEVALNRLYSRLAERWRSLKSAVMG